MKNSFTVKAMLFTQFFLFTYSQTWAQHDIIAPGDKPTVFLQEGVTIPNDQSVPAFTPDGKTVYLADHQKIMVSQFVNHKWTKPVMAAVSGKWMDWDPALSLDGKHLVFVSNRPLIDSPQDKPQRISHLWVADNLGNQKWSAPRVISEIGANAYAPCISKTGSLCFCSRGREGDKKMYGYYAKWLGDHYDKPQLLMLNGGTEVFDPCISPDERFIIFAGDNNNLFISYSEGKGWTPGQKLGPQVNDGGDNGDPVLSPDGKMLYYNSSRAKGIVMIPVNIPRNGN